MLYFTWKLVKCSWTVVQNLFDFLKKDLAKEDQVFTF